MSGSSSSNTVRNFLTNRSVYVSKVRRAFLLQAHPDRFRRYDDTIRLGQERLLQAMSERMALPDFVAYTCGESYPHHQHSHHSTRNYNKNSSLSYYLQGRDGDLLQRTMHLHESVDDVLQSMIDALQQSGVATSLPPPPPPLNQQQHAQQQKAHSEDVHWAPSSTSSTTTKSSVDHRFDINTTNGRDLIRFLQQLDPLQIADRKRYRLDATSAAYMVRRAYKFQAVDGTSMGWSSASLAMLLSSLLALYEEHAAKFNVSSFYPLRLVITPDDFQEPLDVVGGIIRLNPGSTPIQWLETLQLVTTDQLEQLRRNQTLLKEYSHQVQEYFGIKLKRGNSCSAEEYLQFLERVCQSLTQQQQQQQQQQSGQDGTETTNTPFELQLSSWEDAAALALENTGPLMVTVESSSSCRRGTVTKDGAIRVGASMSASAVRLAISKLTVPARKRMRQEQTHVQQCNVLMDQVQQVFGLQRVYRAGMVTISHQQLMDCLQRMMQLSNSNNNNDHGDNDHDNDNDDSMSAQHVKHKLAGNALGVAGSGQFCHLGDDGSLIIPFDWR